MADDSSAAAHANDLLSRVLPTSFYEPFISDLTKRRIEDPSQYQSLLTDVETQHSHPACPTISYILLHSPCPAASGRHPRRHLPARRKAKRGHVPDYISQLHTPRPSHKRAGARVLERARACTQPPVQRQQGHSGSARLADWLAGVQPWSEARRRLGPHVRYRIFRSHLQGSLNTVPATVLCENSRLYD